MQGRRRLLAVAAALHLAIAALFSTHLPVERMLPAAIERPLRVYGGYTGARAHFDFFAPEVGTQARAEFTVSGPGMPPRRLRLATPSREANQRLAMMFTFYGYPEAREALVQSWGRYFLAQHPAADTVEVRVEVLDIPTIARLRDGASASWVEVGRAVVRRGAAG